LILEKKTASSYQTSRALLLAETFGPADAVAAGIVDRIVDAADVRTAAREAATALAPLDPAAHAASKLRARSGTLAALRAAIDADDAELRALVA
jgi:enoyl-CoA hydratase